ncbi:hypothetical protein [Microbacterium aquimaris]|uniref:Uncharacterized protein n=1 Tax=Microbacterium aquimaris TaxID=459816 RepID=A0ABU5NA03_9MICO|nr:hypothetical protein [Microbacterium aquimaris]MDZ8162920.1 hypothetical protein [Microbacterium aquimaris]
MSSSDRQRVEKVRGSRRARLTAAPGTTAEPAVADDDDAESDVGASASGPNDERMRREVPPHY